MKSRTRVVAITALTVALLAGCTPVVPTPAPASHTPSPTASGAASPDGSPTPTTLPADCRSLIGTASTSSFATFALNDPAMTQVPASGVVTPSQPAAGATPEDIVQAATERYCLWRDPQADVTNLELSVSRVEPTVVSALITKLAGQGYICTAPHEGRQCQSLSKDAQYGVDIADTVFARDGFVIRISQANVVTHDLVGSIVASIWN